LELSPICSATFNVKGVGENIAGIDRISSASVGQGVSSLSDYAYALIASWIAVIMATAVPFVGTLVSTGFSELGTML